MCMVIVTYGKYMNEWINEWILLIETFLHKIELFDSRTGDTGPWAVYCSEWRILCSCLCRVVLVVGPGERNGRCKWRSCTAGASGSWHDWRRTDVESWDRLGRCQTGLVCLSVYLICAQCTRRKDRIEGCRKSYSGAQTPGRGHFETTFLHQKYPIPSRFALIQYTNL